MLFVLDDSPQVLETTQQTPKPEAHVPLEVPDTDWGWGIIEAGEQRILPVSYRALISCETCAIESTCGGARLIGERHHVEDAQSSLRLTWGGGFFVLTFQIKDVLFFYCSALKMTKCQTLLKIWHLDIFDRIFYIIWHIVIFLGREFFLRAEQ